MTPLPLVTVADANQIELLRPSLNGRACCVLGSAPLAAPVTVDVGEILIVVNGAISSAPRHADVWFLCSKEQDKPGNAFIRPLHRTMLEQGRGRAANHVVFLRGPKRPTEHYTLETLQRLACRLETWSVLDKPTKRWIEGELCDRREDKKPCSSGILAVATALYCGAASVRLIGFSFQPGYHYLPKENPQSWWRDHVAADKRALVALRARFGNRLALESCVGAAAPIRNSGGRTSLSINAQCACGEMHRFQLDTSGHYSGPLPCDKTRHAELQIDPQEWRDLLTAEQEKTVQ